MYTCVNLAVCVLAFGAVVNAENILPAKGQTIVTPTFPALSILAFQPSAESNYDVKGGMVSVLPEFASTQSFFNTVWGQAVLVKFAALGKTKLTTSFYVQGTANGLSGASASARLMMGTCATSATNGRAKSAFGTAFPDATSTIRELNGGYKFDAQIDPELYVSTTTTQVMSVVILVSGRFQMACADLNIGRVTTGYVGGLNVTYFEDGGSIPNIYTAQLNRAETGITTVSFSFNRYRTGFEYSAELHTTPCVDGGGDVVRERSTMEPAGSVFGKNFNGATENVQFSIGEIVDANAMSMLIKDCFDETGAIDFSGTCNGGRPMMLCINFVYALSSNDESSSTTADPVTNSPTQTSRDCSLPDVLPAARCEAWFAIGYCEPSHRFHTYMATNCQFTCTGCHITGSPTQAPISPTNSPVTSPTGVPSTPPTNQPSTAPTPAPTPAPTREPHHLHPHESLSPTPGPTVLSASPSASPSVSPTSSTPTVNAANAQVDIPCDLGNIADTDHCHNWLSYGFCDELNPWFTFMQLNCARTCDTVCAFGDGLLGGNGYFSYRPEERLDDADGVERLDGGESNPCASVAFRSRVADPFSKNGGVDDIKLQQLDFMLPSSGSEAGVCCLGAMPDDLHSWSLGIRFDEVKQQQATQTLLTIMVASGTFMVMAGLALIVTRKKRVPDVQLQQPLSSINDEYAVIHFMENKPTTTVSKKEYGSKLVDAKSMLSPKRGFWGRAHATPPTSPTTHSASESPCRSPMDYAMPPSHFMSLNGDDTDQQTVPLLSGRMQLLGN